MDDETAIGGGDGRFPATRPSLLVGARSEDPAERRDAYAALITGYWKPIYKHLRLRWRRSNEDAKDLTQDFLAMAIEKRLLDGYDPRQARLRTWLRGCLDRFVQNRDRDAARLKRGGGATHLSLDVAAIDFDLAEAELGPARGRPLDGDAAGGSTADGSGADGFVAYGRGADEVLGREWLRSLFSQAVETLAVDCRRREREVDFRLFELYDLRDDEEDLTYAELAARLDLTVTTVTNRLASVRRRFRAIVLATLREMTLSEDEYRREARDLLGELPE
jgi:RNA polymerase sigma factor (sigma-70 family)